MVYIPLWKLGHRYAHTLCFTPQSDHLAYLLSEANYPTYCHRGPVAYLPPGKPVVYLLPESPRGLHSTWGYPVVYLLPRSPCSLPSIRECPRSTVYPRVPVVYLLPEWSILYLRIPVVYLLPVIPCGLSSTRDSLLPESPRGLPSTLEYPWPTFYPTFPVVYLLPESPCGLPSTRDSPCGLPSTRDSPWPTFYPTFPVVYLLPESPCGLPSTRDSPWSTFYPTVPVTHLHGLGFLCLQEFDALLQLFNTSLRLLQLLRLELHLTQQVLDHRRLLPTSVPAPVATTGTTRSGKTGHEQAWQDRLRSFKARFIGSKGERYSPSKQD